MQWRRVKDSLTTLVMRFSIGLIHLLALLVFVGLFWKASPILRDGTLARSLLTDIWRPMKGQFGLTPFIMGTLEVTGIAMLLAVPPCLLSAIYLSEYASRRVREIVCPVIDVLAGIPSVLYGVWGVIVIVPFVRGLSRTLGQPSTGYSLLAGGILLAIMVFPIIISVTTEVLQAIPASARETALALGLTRWEMSKHVLVRSSLRGILAAIVLAFSRAFGETMAVLMVVGNVPRTPESLFGPAYPLPALIANNYGEMMSIPLYDSALMLAALILLVLVAGFNLAAHLTLMRVERKTG